MRLARQSRWVWARIKGSNGPGLTQVEQFQNPHLNS